MRPKGKLDQIQQDATVAALVRHQGNRSAAARELGINRTTLVERMKKWGWMLPSRNGVAALFKPEVAEVLHAHISDEEWANAVIRQDDDPSRYRDTVEKVEHWLDMSERFGHVSSGAAMGLRSIISEALR